MPIVDSEYYLIEYSLGQVALIPLDTFPLWERKAVAELNVITFGRLEKAEITNKIKMCVCEAAELIYKVEQRQDILSENNDGYSVTYSKPKATSLSIRDIAKAYLPPELLYAGVD